MTASERILEIKKRVPAIRSLGLDNISGHYDFLISHIETLEKRNERLRDVLSRVVCGDDLSSSEINESLENEGVV